MIFFLCVCLDTHVYVCYRYLLSWEGLVEDSNSVPLHLALEDPAAGLSLLRHVAEGWTQVDDALLKVKHILHHIGKSLKWELFI